jgi:hypothetical protein
MGLFPFYNSRKPRRFHYTPVFFDPRKEEMQERVTKVKKELGIPIPDEEFKPNIKGNISGQTRHLRKRLENPEKSSSKTTMIIAIALAILMVLFYYFYLR